MSRMIRRKKKTGKVILSLAAVLLLTVVILLGAFMSAAFVVAKGPARTESARLCATFAERKFPLAGLFFSAEELEHSLFYMPPEVASSDISVSGNEYATALFYIGDVSDAWEAVVITGISPELLSLERRDCTYVKEKYAFGLAGDPAAYLIGDYLSYRGVDDEIYCFCGMGEDGILDIGAMTAYDAANSGYTWGFSAERVLLQNGLPIEDLGGGYGSRVAVGQAMDGSIILAFVNARGAYPAGITYSALASLMYEYGAVNAAAFGVEGGFYADGVGQLGKRGASSFSMIVKGGEH